MIWKGIGRNQRHRRLLELSTNLQRLVKNIGLHASCWRSSVCTTRAAAAHIRPPRRSDIWPPSYTSTFCTQANSWAAKESLVHRQPTPLSSQELAARESLLFSCAAKLSPASPTMESKSEICEGHREAYHSWTWTSKYTRWDRAHYIHCSFSPFLLHPGLERRKKKERMPRCSSQLWLPKSCLKLCCFGNNLSKTPSLLHFRSA